MVIGAKLDFIQRKEAEKIVELANDEDALRSAIYQLFADLDEALKAFTAMKEAREAAHMAYVKADDEKREALKEQERLRGAIMDEIRQCAITDEECYRYARLRAALAEKP